MLRALVIFALTFGIATSLPAQTENRVAFGVLAFGGMKDAHRRWDDTLEFLNDRIPGRRFDLVPLTLDGTDAVLEANGLDFLLTNPGHFQRLMTEHELAPLVSLRTDRPGHLKTGNRYGAVIFARKSAEGPRRLADLRGRKVGAVAPDAFGGWQLALHTLQRNGLDPERDFGELVFFGFPQTAIVRAVLRGDIDAGTVRTGILEAMVAAGEVEEDAFSVLNPIEVPGFDLALSTALVPEWLIAATPAASPELRREVARALLEIEPSEPGSLPAWLPPQSMAPVVEIQASLAGNGGGSPLGAGLPPLVLGMAAVALSALLALASLRRRGPERRGAASPAPGMAKGTEPPPTGGPTAPLTAREEEVLGLVEKGQTTKEIARLLSISPKTVEFHRHNLMQKFEASNMADLVYRSGVWRQANPPGERQT